MLDAFKAAADEMIDAGVDGITTTCGFLALYQRELADHCIVPVATSALLQVPMVARILPKGRRPGDPYLFGRVPHHRATSRPLAPMRRRPSAACLLRSEFQRAIREGDASVPFATLAARSARDRRANSSGRRQHRAHSFSSARTLAPYSRDIGRLTGLPVFDVVTLVHWFHRSLAPERFVQD
mgnify:CR=1 FL=1